MDRMKLLFRIQLLFITGPLTANATDLTLSDSALLCLDWHDPKYNAKVIAVRNVPGPGVEFDVRFAGTTHPNQVIQFISGKYGGAGTLAGLEPSGYDNFSLDFSLVAVDGVAPKGAEGSLVVGAIVYDPANHSRYRPEVIRPSSPDSTNTTRSITHFTKDRVDGLGFESHYLTPTGWKEGECTITLLISPVKDAVPIELRALVPDPLKSSRIETESRRDAAGDDRGAFIPIAPWPNQRPTRMSYHEWLIGMALSSGRSAADAIRDADEIIRTESLGNPEAEKGFKEKAASLNDREVIRLSYVNEGFPLGEAAIESEVEPYPTDPTNTIKNIPKQGDKKRTWGKLAIGPVDKPNHIPFIVDETSAGISMTMDLDQNGDFANDAVIRNYDFHHVDLQLIYGSKRKPYRMCFIIRERGTYFYSVCHLRGQLKVKNDSYAIVIFDNPPDGDYSNNPVTIDLNHDGKADANEKITVGNRIGISALHCNRSVLPAMKFIYRLIKKISGI